MSDDTARQKTKETIAAYFRDNPVAYAVFAWKDGRKASHSHSQTPSVRLCFVATRFVGPAPWISSWPGKTASLAALN